MAAAAAGGGGEGGRSSRGILVEVAQAQEILFSHAEQDGQRLWLILKAIWLLQSAVGGGGWDALAKDSALMAGQESDQQDPCRDKELDLHGSAARSATVTGGEETGHNL